MLRAGGREYLGEARWFGGEDGVATNNFRSRSGILNGLRVAANRAMVLNTEGAPAPSWAVSSSLGRSWECGASGRAAPNEKCALVGGRSTDWSLDWDEPLLNQDRGDQIA